MNGVKTPTWDDWRNKVNELAIIYKSLDPRFPKDSTEESVYKYGAVYLVQHRRQAEKVIKLLEKRDN